MAGFGKYGPSISEQNGIDTKTVRYPYEYIVSEKDPQIVQHAWRLRVIKVKKLTAPLFSHLKFQVDAQGDTSLFVFFFTFFSP